MYTTRRWVDNGIRSTIKAVLKRMAYPMSQLLSMTGKKVDDAPCVTSARAIPTSTLVTDTSRRPSAHSSFASF